jgi:hypothetical protein
MELVKADVGRQGMALEHSIVFYQVSSYDDIGHGMGRERCVMAAVIKLADDLQLLNLHSLNAATLGFR